MATKVQTTQMSVGIDNGSSDSKFVAISEDNPLDEAGGVKGNYFHKIPMYIFPISEDEFKNDAIEYAIRVSEVSDGKTIGGGYFKLGASAHSDSVDWGDFSRKYVNNHVHIMTLFQIALFTMRCEGQLKWDGNSRAKQINVKLGATYNANYNGDVVWMKHVFLGGDPEAKGELRKPEDYIYVVHIKHYDTENAIQYSYQLNIKIDKIVCIREPEAGFRGLVLRKLKESELAIKQESESTDDVQKSTLAKKAKYAQEVLSKVRVSRGYLLDIGSSTLEFWEVNEAKISASPRIANWGVGHIMRDLYTYLLGSAKLRKQAVSESDVRSALYDHSLHTKKKSLQQNSQIVVDTNTFFKEKVKPTLTGHLSGKNIETARYFYYYGGGGTLMSNEIAEWVNSNSQISATPIFNPDKLEYANAYGVAAMVYWS